MFHRQNFKNNETSMPPAQFTKASAQMKFQHVQIQVHL